MKLWEALKISKIREAVGYHRINGEVITFTATDAGITIAGMGSMQQGIFAVNKVVTAPWMELLPHQREAVNKIDWKPIEPKSALVLLAEAISDFHEDVEQQDVDEGEISDSKVE